MDLRKAILLKKPLCEKSLNYSLNSSVYESAAEDSDGSLIYYSFSKSLDESNSDELENSLTSEADNKENTVIMIETDQKETSMEYKEFAKKESDIELPECPKEEQPVIAEDEKMEVEEEEKVQQIQPESIVNVVKDEPIEVKLEPVPLVIPQIIIEDPNENIVNPFTSETFPFAPNQNVPFEVDDQTRKSIETDNVTKRKVTERAKKSASKIPTKTRFYSPLQRTSLDKKSKVIAKPLTRRTIYDTRSATKTVPEKPTVAPKMPAPKPATYKCNFTGCKRDFRTMKLLQEHSKTHVKPVATAHHSGTSSSFKCKWCDKVFEINAALTSHMIDKCTKISFIEKRKLLAQQDKTTSQAVENKRKSVFMAPPLPKKRSPSKRLTLNKSGVMITPKKTLKCECGKLFSNVLEFANHTVAHKYEDALKNSES